MCIRDSVHVVAAGVHQRHPAALGVLGGRGARVRQAGRLGHRQPVHVGAQHHRGPVAVAQHAHDARAPDPGAHLEPGRAQPLGGDARRALLLEGQLGVAVQVTVEGRELVARGVVEPGQDGFGGSGHASARSSR